MSKIVVAVYVNLHSLHCHANYDSYERSIWSRFCVLRNAPLSTVTLCRLPKDRVIDTVLLRGVTPGCSGFSKYENHSLWLVMWFDTPESTYHTSFGFDMLAFIELALALPRRLSLIHFRLLLSPRHSAILDACMCHPSSIRIFPNRSTSSCTRFLFGLSSHNTNIPFWP